MLIIRDTTGITIKRIIQSESHVRIGVFQTAMWLEGTLRFVGPIEKPHGEFDINDCSDLLNELERI